MVNLDSYDSEGPLTPETDDSTEVRSSIIFDLPSSLVLSVHFLVLLVLNFRNCPAKVLVALKMSASSANDLAHMLLSS